MKKKYLILLILLVSNYMHQAQETDTFKDERNGKVYKTVKIGEQWWFAENLNSQVSTEGASIPEGTSKELWKQYSKEKKGCWSFYEGKKENAEKYGILYNWHAATDYKNSLCPKGWDVAKKSDFVNLLKDLGSEEDAFKQLIDGGQLKFNALLGGSRYPDCSFNDLGKHSIFWTKSSSTESEREAMALGIGTYDNKARLISTDRNSGGYIRCVKKQKVNTDNKVQKEEENKNTFIDKRDNQVYATVSIGQQLWMAENLRYDTGEGSYDCDKLKAERTLPKCGRYYNWETAQNACPDGWRLPTDKEILELIKAAGDSEQYALHALKQGGESGFNALLCGDCNLNSRYYNGIKTTTAFWTGTTIGNERVYSLYLSLPSDAKLNEARISPDEVKVVRCIKNNP